LLQQEPQQEQMRSDMRTCTWS